MSLDSEELIRTLRSLVYSWDEVNLEICRTKKWNLIMIFPAFTLQDANIIKKGIQYAGSAEILEIDTRFSDGEIDFFVDHRPISLEVIAGSDEKLMKAVPRIITDHEINFIVLMTGEYWCFYAPKPLLEAAVEMALTDFHEKTRADLANHYGEIEMLTYQSKLEEIEL